MNRSKEHGLSKFMSMILRHQAENFGLEMDENNFIDLNQFIQVVRREWSHGSVSVADILYIAHNSKKQGLFNRFQIVDGKIRATYNLTQKPKK